MDIDVVDGGSVGVGQNEGEDGERSQVSCSSNGVSNPEHSTQNGDNEEAAIGEDTTDMVSPLVLAAMALRRTQGQEQGTSTETSDSKKIW